MLFVNSGVSLWSEDSIYFQLRVFPEDFEIIQLRYLMATAIHVICFCAGDKFLSHFMRSLEVGSDNNSSRMVVRNFLSLRYLQIPSRQRKFLRTHFHFLDQTNYSQKNRILFRVERPLDIFVGLRESCCWTVHQKRIKRVSKRSFD